MLRNYLKIAFRNLLRFKIYSLINLFGLAVGLTVGVLILLFVTDELTYDEFHTNSDRIYKIVTTGTDDSGMETNAWPVAHKLVTDFPEVESVIYSRKAPANMMVNFMNKRYEHNMYYASEDFFNMFSFTFVEGDPKSALDRPFSLVITEDIRDRYFGADLAVGRTLTLRDSLEFIISGVVKNVPEQSHIQYEMLASFSTYAQLSGQFSYSEGWGNFNMRNYLMLAEGANIAEVKAKAAGLYMENAGDWLKEMGVEFSVDFIPLKNVYLESNYANGFGPKGSVDQVYLVSAIAIFVIVLACINFVNITTARSVYRAKEVGLRKIVGSTRASLFWQFLIESFVLTLLAFGVVALFIDFTLPFFNELMGKNYALTSLLSANVVVGVVVMVLAVSFLAGYYPAMVLSGYQPAQVLKGSMHSSKKGASLRRGLVVFQFVISGGLVLSTLVVLKQLDYMRNQDLGFDKEQILVLDATRVPESSAHMAFKNSLETIASVEAVSHTNALPGRPGWLGQWAYPETIENAERVETEYMSVDENYLKTLGLQLVAGEDFNLNKKAQLDEGVIINETTVKEMGWNTPENALGKKIVSPSHYPQGTVIGVVKDFHGLGLQDKIWPQVMDYSSEDYGRYYAVRFTTGSTASIINNAEELWAKYLGDYTYEYYFLDEDFNRQYQSEERLMQIFILFAVITVVIAGIGLLGLVSFMVVSRSKEISIRKVLGADVMGLAGLLSKEYAVLVIVANLLVIPFVWFLGNRWLENFAFHTAIDPVIFIISLLVTLGIAVLTVSFQTIRAAMADPMEKLRSE